MSEQRNQIGEANASPTKAFFVRMLTRDIELQDALLDLLDNCLDGIARTQRKPANPDLPYQGFGATMILAPTYFLIEDNCGGIPIEVARRYAFTLGREPETAEPEITNTVGMYGIGMKRAIFKLGTDAFVESRNDTGFLVEFTKEWMADPKWSELPMYELPKGKLSEAGTRIQVHELSIEATAAFKQEGWIDEFRKLVARTYSLIIAKGFEVRVGVDESEKDKLSPVPAEPFRLIKSTELTTEKSAIQPYVYKGCIGDVAVEIYAGLYRQLLSEAEAEEEEETRGRTDDAGWTIACNDRVVVWKDKSRLTGWGEASVPNYHGQFIAITGIVLLAGDVRKLPLTSTKRGIDAGSNTYSEIKDLMREATKKLTSFTNKWKRFPDGLEKIYKDAEYVDLPAIRELTKTLPLEKSRKSDDIRKYEPTYPVPPEEKTSVRVSFTADKRDVSAVAKLYFDEPVKPGDVGKAAFDDAVKRAKGETK